MRSFFKVAGTMADNTPPANVVVETLNALEDALLERASPEVRWFAATTRLLPRHAAASAQHYDAFQQQCDLAAATRLAENSEDALVENWTHSAERLARNGHGAT